MSDDEDDGFTLVEILIALAITGLVALMARKLVQVTLDSVRALAASRERADQDANARVWLRSTLLSLEVGDSAGSFAGNPARMELSAWVQQPGGWLERRRITVEARDRSLIAIGATEEPLRLVDSVDAVAFDYLLEPGANTGWVQQWLSPVSAPLGVRVRIAHPESTDTLLLLIKERG